MASRRSRKHGLKTFSSYSPSPIQSTFSIAANQARSGQRMNLRSGSSISSSPRNAGREPISDPPALIQQRPNPASVREEDDETADHRILAIDRHGKLIGCSYYVAGEETLLCMQEIEGPSEELIGALKLDIQPTIVLVSPRLELPERTINTPSSSRLIDHDEPVLPYELELRPSFDFKYEQAVQKLASISTLRDLPGVRFLVPGEEYDQHEKPPGGPGMIENRGRILHLSSSLNLESKTSIGCAGAIITYLQKRRASEYLHNDPAANEAYQILRLEMFSLKNTMLINSDTFTALQIFQSESHPSASKQGPGSSGSKESLSIYGLFHHFARSPGGKQRLRSFFLHPSTDLDVICSRHDSITILAKLENRDFVHELSKSMSKIKNVRGMVTKLRKGIEGGTAHTRSIKSGIWSSVLDFCFHGIAIADTLCSVSDIKQLALYRRLYAALDTQEFQRIGKMVCDVVDLEQSQAQHRTVIQRGINEMLDKVKDAYDNMDDMLSRTAIEIVAEFPEPLLAIGLSVVYIPQLGFFVTMSQDVADELKTRGLNDEWERRFTTESHAYFKNARMRTMDRELGDLWAIICDTEIEISHGLAQGILQKEVFLIEASDVCSELDALLALTHGAAVHKLRKPRMVDDNMIDIRSGRHLIHEMSVPAYVANDTFLVGGSGTNLVDSDEHSENSSTNPTMLLLTGPNYSGKSVYLNQIALIVYMAQVGSFVPAEAARIGVTDKIMTRITTRETVSRGQSSFMIDLQQISWALKTVTNRSLLVIDEFGKGTDTCDGAGLCAGVLAYLLNLGYQAPKVVASTHFHEIFEQGIISENAPGLGLCQMQVHIQPRSTTIEPLGSPISAIENDSNEVTYLYTVQPGRSTLSYGAQCAAMNGVPTVIVNRACKLTKLALNGEDLVAICSGTNPEEVEDLLGAEKVCRTFLALDLDSTEEDHAHNIKSDLKELLAKDSDVSAGISTANLSTRQVDNVEDSLGGVECSETFQFKPRASSE